MGQCMMGFMPTFERATSAGTWASLSCWGGKGSGGSRTGVLPGSHGAAQPASGTGSKQETSDGLCRGQGVQKAAGGGQGRVAWDFFPLPADHHLASALCLSVLKTCSARYRTPSPQWDPSVCLLCERRRYNIISSVIHTLIKNSNSFKCYLLHFSKYADTLCLGDRPCWSYCTPGSLSWGSANILPFSQNLCAG